MCMGQESRKNGRRLTGVLLVVCILFSLSTAGLAENPEEETLGTLTTADRAWEVSYLPIAGYSIYPELIREDAIIIDLEPADLDQSRMNLAIIVSENWQEAEQFSDLSPEDLKLIQDTFLVENDAPTFEIAATSSGLSMLIVRSETGRDAFLFTIQHGIEIELHLISDTEDAKLSSDDLQCAITFLNGITILTD